jgi:signal transduction histidine kinase
MLVLSQILRTLFGPPAFAGAGFARSFSFISSEFPARYSRGVSVFDGFRLTDTSKAAESLKDKRVYPYLLDDKIIRDRARMLRGHRAFVRSSRWVGSGEGKSLGERSSMMSVQKYSSFGETPKRPMANRIIERGLRVRILTGFTLVILLTLLIAGWSYYHISTLSTASEHLFIENYRTIGYMHVMESALEGMEAGPAANFRNNDSIFRYNLALEYANITEPGELEATQRIDRDYQKYLAARSAALSDPSNANILNERSLADIVNADCEIVLHMNERAMFSRSEAVKAEGQFARTSTLLITILLVGIAVFLAVAVSRRSLAEFQELDRAKSNFVATAAHELKNPLSTIKTTSGVLADNIAGPLTEKQRELVTTIRRESNRLLNLVRELLDLAKLETGTLQLHEARLDIETLIESAILPVAMRAEEAEVKIDIAVMPNVPEVFVDPNKMAWAITNVLSNAIRYSPRGSAVTATANVNENEIWISITDRGKGIAESDLTRIFDKFVQVEEGVMGMGAGTGLGLAIAREIVLAHGGRIWGTSTVGSGSTFTIALPLHSK